MTAHGIDGISVSDDAISDLGRHVSLQRGTTYKSRLLGQPGPILLGLATIGRNGGFRADNLQTYGGESPPKLLLAPGDLYVSLKDVTQSGDLLGAVARVPRTVSAGRVTQDTVKLLSKPGSASASYLYWLLRTPDYRDYCRERATGTTNLALSRDDFLAYPVPQECDDRKAIVELLQAIEEKIELKRTMTQTLEALAQRLFKSWFVDFDPVVAKKEGRKPFGMNAQTADLFPSHFSESDLGPVPEGWRVAKIGEVVKVVGGSTPSTSNADYWTDGGHVWMTPRDMSRLSDPVILESGRNITDKGLAEISSGLLPAGTVLLSSRAPIGYTGIAGVPLAINQGFIAMICEGVVGPQFVLRWTQDSMEEIVSRAGGTTFAEISKSAFRPIPVLVPSEVVACAFEHAASTWHEQLVHNVRESTTLQALRDLLLSKLLSGEIHLKEAEKVVGEAI